MIYPVILTTFTLFLLLEGTALMVARRRGGRVGLLVGWAAGSLGLKLPFLAAVVGGVEFWFAFPPGEWYYFYALAVVAYHLLLLAILPLWMVAWALQALGTRLRTLGKPKPGGTLPAKRTTSREAHNDTLTRRDFLAMSTGYLPAFALPGSGAWAFLMRSTMEAPLLETISVTVPNLHADMEGFRICQVSDIHFGAQLSLAYLDVCRDLLRSVKADLLVITGDIIDTNNHYLPVAARFFAQVADRFGLGVLGIAGNHDYFHDGEHFFRTLQGSAIRMLRNHSVEIRRGHGRLQVAGIDSPFARAQQESSRAGRVLAAVHELPPVREDVPTVLLAHDPADFPLLEHYGARLILSGHTHGGQWDFSGDDARRLGYHPMGGEFYRGRYERGKAVLYVNRGLGSWLPARVNAPAEVTIIELVRS